MAMFNGPVNGVHIVVASRESNPPGLREFIQVMNNAGIPSIGEVDPKEPIDQFRIIVGSNPH
jgi:hypothetical protein